MVCMPDPPELVFKVPPEMFKLPTMFMVAALAPVLTINDPPVILKLPPTFIVSAVAPVNLKVPVFVLIQLKFPVTAVKAPLKLSALV